jgi:hypothetical protein
MADESKEPEKFILQELVYTGVVILKGGTLGYAYGQVNPQGDGMAKPAYYKKRLIGYERVGQIIQVRVTLDGESVYKQGRKVIDRVWRDAADILRWDAQSRQQQAEYDTDKASRKAAKGDPAAAALEVVRQAYQDAGPAARAQLLARFVYHISKPY